MLTKAPINSSHQNVYDPMFFYLFIALATNTLVFGIFNLVMWYVYVAKISFFQQFRETNDPWPWELDAARWRLTLQKTLKIVFINLYIISALFTVFEYKITKSSYNTSLQAWPSTTTMISQFLFFLMMQDLTFYWTHTAFHSRYFYWIHKKHHEYTTTVSIAATYAHPLQFIFGNILPTGIGYHILGKIVDVHFVTIIVWLVFRDVEGSQVHSGYNWSWRQMSFMPWKSGPDHHDFHHRSNVGNFGSMFEFWDNLMKTNAQYTRSKNKKVQ